MSVREAPSSRTTTRLAVAALIVFAAAFLATGAHRLTMPFGDSHDGRNGAQWGLGSRDLRLEGPAKSKLGAELAAGTVRYAYTDHPPIIYTETAAAETVAGEHPWSTRLPAWLGSLAAIALLYRLLRRCSVGPVAAASGTVLGLGCPMFAGYGLMNDPWILGLPWGIGIIVLWQRSRAGGSDRFWLVFGVALIGALTSWVNVIELALIGAAELLGWQRGRRQRQVLTPLTLGSAMGVVLTFAWIAWAHGTVRSVIDQAIRRSSGGTDVHLGPSLVISAVRGYWASTFTPWQLVLAIPILVAGAMDARTRAVLGVALGTVVLWMVAFSDGAVHHDYWGYWMVLPLAVGFAATVEAAIEWLGSTSSRSSDASTRGLLVAATAVGIAGLALPTAVTNTLNRGSQAGAALAAARSRLPTSQRVMWYLGDLVQTPYWVGYPFHLPEARLTGVRAVDRLAATAPGDLVLVASNRLTPDLLPSDSAAPCRAGVPTSRDYAVSTARALDLSLRSGPCPARAAESTARPGPNPPPPAPYELAP